MADTVSDFLWERLRDWNVQRIYGYPGDGINGLMGALARSADTLEFIQARHEEQSAFMACGHAKFGGGLGVCLATSGPGAIHLLNGLSGRHAFQYRTEAGVQSVSADDVNQYLNDASAGVITAKDFRTWQASVCVAAEFAATPCEQTGPQTTRACKGALTKAAALLGNTVTVCRKYYVHTGIVDAFCSGEYPRLTAAFAPRRSKWLARDEQLLMHVLRNVAS